MTFTTLPSFRSVHLRPAFWGLDRDFKEVVDQIENTWSGKSTTAYEVKETDKAYFMAIDMPGVNKKDLEIRTEDKVLFINGIRKNPFASEESEEEARKDEKKISHTVRLPDAVNRDQIQARCEDGVLYLALPKVDHVRAKKIEVMDGFDQSSWGNLLEKSEAP